jgi:hypothetical protein
MSRTSVRQAADWTASLDAGRPVELTAGDRLVVRVDAAGVLLTEADLLVTWMDVGSAWGVSTERFSGRPGSLTLFVSRTWWTDQLGRTPTERDARGAWEPSIETTFRSFRRPVPAAELGDWLTEEVVRRAPLPERLALTPSADPVFDRDSGRRVPLDRLALSHTLRADLLAWAAPAADVPDAHAQHGEDAAWERYWPPGRKLAARLEQETGRPSAVWADCPEVP